MIRFTEALLRDYRLKKRSLPWRDDPTPYHVWLSETMLQQTRIEAVKGYYARFLSALPTIQSLADADEDLCLKLWEGLGYYSRIRNMQKAAKMVMEDYGGELPDSVEELRKLPGVGEYTANAIAAFAFQKKALAVDGNLIRLYARLEESPLEAKTPQAKAAAYSYFFPLIPEERPGDFNQALMDIGETICLPHGKPLCSECPLAPWCKAHREGKEEAFPILAKPKEKKREDVFVYLLVKEGKVAIRKRPSSGLLAGLYEFPNEVGVGPQEGARSLGKSSHLFSHLRWEIHWYEGDPSSSLAQGCLWVSFEELEGKYSLPSAFSAYKKWLPSLVGGAK